ncbi:unnamed protein product, partial [Ectocarpus sp. 8 AP-2014]
MFREASGASVRQPHAPTPHRIIIARSGRSRRIERGSETRESGNVKVYCNTRTRTHQEHHGRSNSTTAAAATTTSAAAAAATERAPHPVSVEQGRREHGRPAEGTFRAARGSAPKDDRGRVLAKLDHTGAPGSQAGAGADCREPRE